MKKITLKEIAQHFRVSISTVSKAINDSHEISEELKSRINEYASKHHYRPNKVALNLLNKNTKTLGVVIPNILNYFFVQVLYGIEKVADEMGYSIITCITNQSLKKEVKTLGLFGTGTVDGVIISSAAEESELNEHSKHIEELTENQIPIVMFDRVIESIECDKVIVDDFEAGYKATKFFLETGCRTIAIINPIADSVIGRLRIEGHKKALKEANISFDQKLIANIDLKDDLDLTMSLLLNYRKIEGILALDEMTAVQTNSVLKRKGYHVPKDISIVGFTNGQLSKYVSPSITMISQHGKYIGELSANILIDRIENKKGFMPFTTKLVKTSLIERESTLKLP